MACARLETLRIVGSGGANRAMEAELKRLARRALGGRLEAPLRFDEQTLLYPFDVALADLAVHYLRSCSRVLWDLYEVRALRLEPLYEQLRAMVASDDRPWLESGGTIAVDARAVRDFAASPLQLRGAVKNAMIDGARDRGVEISLDAESPIVPLVVRGVGDALTIGIDLAGRAMHSRGYRLHIGDAPLKETLAAQMLILARWDPRSEVLVDPMCGAGTIVLEAAAMAEGAPVWSPERPPAADGLQPFREAIDRPRTALFPGGKPQILGGDVDRRCIEAARQNLLRLRTTTQVELRHSDLCDLEVDSLLERGPASRGLVVTNPPYGHRLSASGPGPHVHERTPHAPPPDEPGVGDIEALYRDFAAWCEQLRGPWRVAVLSGHPEFERIVGWRPTMKKPMWNGPLAASFSTYEL